MKRMFRYLYASLGLVLLLVSCTPNDYEMGAVMSKSDLKFSITQNSSDPNMVVLSSNTAGAAPYWSTPLGRSTRVQDTCKLPFPGTYKFVYGVMSAGGFVKADTVVVNITTTNLSYVNDPLWTMLTGGAGHEKTWVLDLFPDTPKMAKIFAGPLYFYGTDDSWTTVTDKLPASGSDSWNWCPDYKGNSWLMPAGDYGTMTFSLKGNATVTVNHLMIPSRGTEVGSYFLDVNAKMLTMTDATPLHDAGRDAIVLKWGKIKVLSLTDKTMQLAVVRDNDPKEGKCLLVYNFISKEASDAWTPQ